MLQDHGNIRNQQGDFINLIQSLKLNCDHAWRNTLEKMEINTACFLWIKGRNQSNWLWLSTSLCRNDRMSLSRSLGKCHCCTLNIMEQAAVFVLQSIITLF